MVESGAVVVNVNRKDSWKRRSVMYHVYREMGGTTYWISTPDIEFAQWWADLLETNWWGW